MRIAYKMRLEQMGCEVSGFYSLGLASSCRLFEHYNRSCGCIKRAHFVYLLKKREHIRKTLHDISSYLDQSLVFQEQFMQLE
jgi:hypothetical protein